MMHNQHWSRRQFLGLLAHGCALCLGLPQAKESLLINPCDPAQLPQNLAASPWLSQVWEGLEPSQIWDSHVHLAGSGDTQSGIALGPRLSFLRYPFQYGKRLFFKNGGYVQQQKTLNQGYATRLIPLCQAQPQGFKALLFAFNRFHGQSGRPDALERLAWAVAQGARAVKWLPSAMGIDPISSRCRLFYQAMADWNLPLIVHSGAERALFFDLALKRLLSWQGQRWPASVFHTRHFFSRKYA